MIVFVVFFVVVVLFSFVLLRGAPYVPSQRRYLKRALTDLYRIDEKDTLVDVGSGDGVVLRTAASLGARAIGYELNPFLVLLSKLIGGKNTETHLADFWRVRLPPETTVVYVFMIQSMSLKLEKKLQAFVNDQGKAIKVIAFGIPFRQRQAEKTLDASFLYTFQPLQSE